MRFAKNTNRGPGATKPALRHQINAYNQDISEDDTLEDLEHAVEEALKVMRSEES